MVDTDLLLMKANERIEGTMRLVELEDPIRLERGVSCGFRDEDGVFVAHLKWKRVKYRGRETYNFRLEVFSLDSQAKVKVKTERIIPGGLGKKREISLPALKLEVTREFKVPVPVKEPKK